MALIHCPDCGLQVSEHADICTKCSYPINKLKVNRYVSSESRQEKNMQPANVGLIYSGYVLAFLTLIYSPIVYSLAGVIIGIINIAKGNTGHGIAHIVLSLLFGCIGFFVGVIAYFL